LSGDRRQHPEIRCSNNQKSAENKKNIAVILTKKIGIYPTHEQEAVLFDLSDKCRLIYNFAQAERFKNWEENRDKPKEARVYITYYKQQNDLSAIKEKYPEYKWTTARCTRVRWGSSTRRNRSGSGLDGSPAFQGGVVH
jgi:hypothetical protein